MGADTSFSLRRPSGYSIEQGARFEVHIEKGRGLHGDHARPFEPQVDLTDGKAGWIVKDVEDALRIRVAALLAAGMSAREIAEETGATKSGVHPMKQRIEREEKEREGGEEAGPGRRMGEAAALSPAPRVLGGGTADCDPILYGLARTQLGKLPSRPLDYLITARHLQYILHTDSPPEK